MWPKCLPSPLENPPLRPRKKVLLICTQFPPNPNPTPSAAPRPAQNTSELRWLAYGCCDSASLRWRLRE